MAATLRAFRDRRCGEVDIESAPLGMLLVIAVGDAYAVGLGDHPLGSATGGFAIGPQSCHGRSALTGTAEGVQVDLSWSTAATVFGPDLADLADECVMISDLPGGTALVDRLASGSPPVRLGLVREWLRERAHSHTAPTPLTRHALRRIEDGSSSVSQLAAELGCSRGHLHRTVRAVTGQSPTTLMRIVRLHRLINDHPVINDGSAAPLAELAASGGYADHAHLCHETRQLSGRTPSELFGRSQPAQAV